MSIGERSVKVARCWRQRGFPVCDECGKRLKPHHKFCIHCGVEKVRQKQKEVVRKGKIPGGYSYCPRCEQGRRAVISIEGEDHPAVYCYKCGTELETEPPADRRIG